MTITAGPVADPDNGTGPASAPSVGDRSSVSDAFRKLLHSEGLILLALAPAGFMLTYFYERGSAIALDIPPELIVIDPLKVVAPTIVTVLLSSLLLKFVLFGTSFARAKVNPKKGPNYSWMAWQIYLPAIAAIAAAAQYNPNGDFRPFMVAVGVCLVAEMVHGMSHSRSLRPSWRHVTQARASRLHALDRLELGGAMRAATIAVSISMSGLAIALFAQSVGSYMTSTLSSTNDYLVTTSEPRYVLVKRYGDTLVLGEVEMQSGRLRNGRKLVSADSAPEFVVTRFPSGITP